MPAPAAIVASLLAAQASFFAAPLSTAELAAIASSPAAPSVRFTATKNGFPVTVVDPSALGALQNKTADSGYGSAVRAETSLTLAVALHQV
jgi:hypothetical protein